MVDASQVASSFNQRFGGVPRLFRAPGRVNLIGEHTDYNDGFVMPVAIDLDTVVAAALRDDNTLRIYSENLEEEVSIDLAKPTTSAVGSWTSYVEGVARVLMSRGDTLKGCDIVILSDVPDGAGLSSSAALELSVGTALTRLNNISISATELALVCQQAEHEFAGTKSGIMDQFISALGQVDQALLVDCRSLTFESISIQSDSTTWIVMDTKVKHSLASSAYNERRQQCEEAVKTIQQEYPEVNALRDVDIAMLLSVESSMEEVIFRRARHVITENARTLAAAKALTGNEMETMGKLMFESHASLRGDYEVTCAELDLLVDLGKASESCLGSRMTGGGFGGCTISLVSRGDEAQFIAQLSSGYESRFGFAPQPIMIHSSRGAHGIV